MSRELDGKLHAVIGVAACSHIRLILTAGHRLLQNTTELDLAPDAACLDVGESTAEVCHSI